MILSKSGINWFKSIIIPAEDISKILKLNKLIIAIVLSSFIYAQCLGDVNDDYIINIQDVVLVVNNIIYSTDIDYSADILSLIHI